MNPDQSIRAHTRELLGWQSAHIDFVHAVSGVPPTARGVRPTSLPHSLWELVEHIRLAQQDILDFCLDPGYEEPEWPEAYWPAGPEPPTADAWQGSIDRYLRDRQTMIDLVENDAIILHDTILHGDGQTYLREALLVADHTAYHVGQIVLVRRLLNIWPP